MSKNVHLIKLNNGEFWIGEIVDSDCDKVVKMLKPLQLIHVPDNDGKPGVALISLTEQFSTEDELEFNTTNILYTMVANENIVGHYIQQTTGIALATAGVGGASLDISDLTS